MRCGKYTKFCRNQSSQQGVLQQPAGAISPVARSSSVHRQRRFQTRTTVALIRRWEKRPAAVLVAKNKCFTCTGSALMWAAIRVGRRVCDSEKPHIHPGWSEPEEFYVTFQTTLSLRTSLYCCWSLLLLAGCYYVVSGTRRRRTGHGCVSITSERTTLVRMVCPRFSDVPELNEHV